MRVIGLVGGIGSGKSTAAAMLAELGALVLHADLIGHEIYRSGTPGFSAIAAEFGPEVVGDDGEIDRRRLGAFVFADPARLARLDRITHPLIRSELRRRLDEAKRSELAPLVVVDAAILLEAGWRDLVDEVWVVSAARGRVVERLEAQRGLTPAEAEARIARQMSDAERRVAADVVIENDGTLDDLRGQLLALWRSRVSTCR